jgi:hypothetical protein
MSIVQSVILKRSHFTLREAKEWVAKEGYKHSKVDITPHTFRFRQVSPELVKTGYRPRMVKLGDMGYVLIFYPE